MAELDSRTNNSRNAGRRRSKKQSTRVDLTPMVDLGFLLITFFILTTTWSAPRVTNLNMPAGGDSSVIGKGATLTVIPLYRDRVFYYHGNFEDALAVGDFGITGYQSGAGIGGVIREKQSAMDRFYKGGRKEMMLLIKPARESSYKNLISLLDETLINQVGKYAIVDLSEKELQVSESYSGKGGESYSGRGRERTVPSGQRSR